MGRLASRGDAVYEKPLDPSPETDPRKPATNLDDWRTDSEASAAEEMTELRLELDPDGWTPDDAFE